MKIKQNLKRNICSPEVSWTDKDKIQNFVQFLVKIQPLETSTLLCFARLNI